MPWSVFSLPARRWGCRGRARHLPRRQCHGQHNLHLSPHLPLSPHPSPLRRLLVPSTTPTALRFVQLVPPRSTVVTLVTPASSTVMGTASAANDPTCRRSADSKGL